MISPALVALLMFHTLDPEPTVTEQPAKVDLQGLESDYLQAKSLYDKMPSEENRADYVTKTVQYATQVMTSPELESKVKYPKALKLYREALKVDPKNETAIENRDMIEGIYKSLNKPIPN